MNAISKFLSRLTGGLLKLVLISAAAVFIVSLLIATLVVMLVLGAWSLLTGRKPDPARIFGQFRQTSARFTAGTWPGSKGQSGRTDTPADIVDVPADAVREVQDSNEQEIPDPNRPDKVPMARMMR